MERIAEFRGKNKQGKWVYGSLVETTFGLKHKPKQQTKTWIVWSAFGNGGWFNVCGRDYVIPETVGRFTGLLDCEGKKIYEGDIVENFLTDIFQIKWLDCGARFCLYSNGSYDTFTQNLIK